MAKGNKPILRGRSRLAQELKKQQAQALRLQVYGILVGLMGVAAALGLFTI